MEIIQHHQVDHHANHHHIVPQPVNPNCDLSLSSGLSPTPDQIGSPSLSPSSDTPTTTLINASHYQMLVTGNENDLGAKVLDESLNLADLATEFEHNSALHIAAMAGQHRLIGFIVTQFNTDDSNHRRQHLLLRPNKKGDLPIHVATRAGKKLATEKLIECAASSTVAAAMCSQMLEAENQDGNTALHIALQNQQKCMSEILFTSCQHIFYRLNRQGFSPLYLAIIAGFDDLAADMLQTGVEEPGCTEKQLDRGKVVHAAIMAKNLCIFRMMLEKYPDLNRSSDEQARRPLSYAAYTGFLEGVKYLLNNEAKFKNIAFRPDDINGDLIAFPIHRACSGGNIQVMKEFLDHSPDMMSLLNKKQQNILHVAAESGKAKVVHYILGRLGSESLVNMKDEDGNTPLHLASKGKHPKVVYALTWDDRVKLNLQNNDHLTALDIAEDYGLIPSFEERLTWLALRYAGVPRAPQIHQTIMQTTLNQSSPIQENGIHSEIANGTFTAQEMDHANPSQVPSGIANEVVSNLFTVPAARNEYLDQTTPTNKYKERVNTLLMVSTLVATVTFASGFTVPGGYRQEQDKPNIGMAVLANKCAFQVFVISNTIALFSSILAAVTLIWAHLDDLRLILLALDFALPLLGTALVMMSVAFMAGLYVTLHTKKWLGIVVLVMGGEFLLAVLVFFVPLYSPTSRIRSKMLRYVFHVPFKLMLLACEKGKSATLY